MRLLNLKYSTVVLVIFLSLTIQKVKAQVNTQDSLALVDLYDSTGGPNWTNNTNWLTSAPVSSWYGVNVNGGRVIKLGYDGKTKLFQHNNINGNIPASISNLTNLESLSFSANTIGLIPSSLGNLTNLKYLDLSANGIHGVISSSLGNLINLQYLYLNNNYFTGTVPESLGNLTNLIVLNLYSNVHLNFSPIPPSFGNLVNLQFLRINKANFNGSLPDSFSNLVNLKELDLFGDYLSGNIPDWIGNLSNLEVLDLSSNQFNGSIPSTIGKLTKLGALTLDDNQLTGTIPSSIENLSNLKSLSITGNKFTFAGMESLAQFHPINYPYTNGAIGFSVSGSPYSPQSQITLYNNNSLLYASVDGTPKNDTFRWYKDSMLIATKVGDSTYTVTTNGKYFVNVTNAVATQLTLNSKTQIITNLPVTLFSFTAKAINNTIQTNWYTSTELNTRLFIIQHSTDGSTFTDIGTVKAIGSGANGYQYTDETPTNGINYYRIKSVDKDGSFAYSKIVPVQLTVNSNQLSVFPNPSKDKVTVRGNHIAYVQVVDNLGRVLKSVSFKDVNNPILSLAGMPAGIYHLRIQTADGKVNGANLMVNY